MTMRKYQWTSDDDGVVTDAVIVVIGPGGPALTDNELTAFPPLAVVYWPSVIMQGDRVEARMEGLFEPGVALDYAEEMAALYGFPRVVVAIQERSLWDDAWGLLEPEPGF